MSLKFGLKAVEEQRYGEAVELLTYFCENCYDYKSQEYIQAKIGLARAYYGLGERQQVVYICQELIRSERLSVRQWAQQWLNSIQAVPKYTPEELQSILNTGRQALKDKNYPLAIKSLEEYCQHNHQPDRLEHQQAKMWLTQAYTGTKDIDAAISVCEELNLSHDTMIQQWAKQKLPSLKFAQNKQKQVKYSSDATYIEEYHPHEENSSSDFNAQTTIKASYLKTRATKTDIKLKMPKITGNLVLAMLLTLILIFFPTFILIFLIIFAVNLAVNLLTINWILLFSIGLSLVVEIAVFYLSPPIIDLNLKKIDSLRWVPINEIGTYSNEAAEIIEEVCLKHKFKTPRLGIIDDPNPIAFIYGSVANQSRLVVSQGLLSYLDEQEIATVYAYQLGRLVKKDVSIITLGYSLVGLITMMTPNGIKPNLFYTCGTYLLFYLSRTAAYHGDHFATEITGNPNALIRALIKIAYGIVEENYRSEESSNLLKATRILGIYDHYLAIPTGIVSEEKNLGKVITWDLFNPWARWLELNTTHPLTGKRLGVLTDYIEQLELNSEHNLIAVIAEGKKLNQRKLRHNFGFDLLMSNLPAIGLFLGLAISLKTPMSWLSLSLLGLGLGIIIKSSMMYLLPQKLRETNIINLFTSPYTNPFRGTRVKLSGELIGGQKDSYWWSSQFILQDSTAMIEVNYVPLLQPKLDPASSNQVTAIGWFRRGINPYLDLRELTVQTKKFKSYQGIWSLAMGLSCLVLALILN